MSLVYDEKIVPAYCPNQSHIILGAESESRVFYWDGLSNKFRVFDKIIDKQLNTLVYNKSMSYKDLKNIIQIQNSAFSSHNKTLKGNLYGEGIRQTR